MSSRRDDATVHATAIHQTSGGVRIQQKLRAEVV